MILVVLAPCSETSLGCITFSPGTIQISGICFCFIYCSGCFCKTNNNGRKCADFRGQEWSGDVYPQLLDRDSGLLRQDSTRGSTSQLQEATDERTGTLAFGYPKHRRLHGTLPTKSPHPRSRPQRRPLSVLRPAGGAGPPFHPQPELTASLLLDLLELFVPQ